MPVLGNVFHGRDHVRIKFFNGRALSLKKKDNVESQVGPSSQKSIGKGPKNSSTIKKPESHKNSDEEKVESDDGSEFEGTNFEGSDFEESDYDSEDELEDKFVQNGNDGSNHNQQSFVPPIQNMRNPNPSRVPPNMRVGMNNTNFKGPSNPIRPQNPQPMRPIMQNRGTGVNPSFGSRMNNPTFPQQGPQFRGNPQFGGPSTFGQNNHFTPQMFPNSGHGNYNPVYTPLPVPEQVNANYGNNQPEQDYYIEYRDGREVRIPYRKSNWWEEVTDRFQ
uniref:Uncharacterized protein n=1 Tax=Meloidogyne javanica TaxID=6303 RepID=A0A915LTS9_MELJA